ncbi:hypothetical protein [Nesterenkonia sp.]|uniref:hypothetical protein n=1 Tax=Nesterenkonia sp. TaxID=704201 RepID=UPI0026339E5B|nr:hypothetical protein [Nesterenkonia sp.]
MAKPFGVGDVVGGRYRITHHVVTSADQDIVFQATDEVLSREVSVLVASRANAKQVATSAKELATGERSSEVQVLDLGLAEDRTYLISTLVDPNELLDLVVPDAAPYVEPYFTDSLGSELFGQSREMQPQTYDDDAEYYARLQADLAGESEGGPRLPGFVRRRPAFLDKVTPQHGQSGADDAGTAADRPQESPPRPVQQEPVPASFSSEDLQSALEEAGDAHGIQPSQEIQRVFSLRTDLEEVDVDPSADVQQETLEAVYAWAPKAEDPSPDSKMMPTVEEAENQEEPEGPLYEQAPSAAISTLSASGSATGAPPEVDERLAEGEEVVDDPPAEPDPRFEPQPGTGAGGADSGEESFGSDAHPPTRTAPAAELGAGGSQQDPATFTSLITAVPSRAKSSFPAPEGSASSTERDSEASGSGSLTWWLAAVVLAALVLAAAVILFNVLN